MEPSKRAKGKSLPSLLSPAVALTQQEESRAARTAQLLPSSSPRRHLPASTREPETPASVERERQKEKSCSIEEDAGNKKRPPLSRRRSKLLKRENS